MGHLVCGDTRERVMMTMKKKKKNQQPRITLDVVAPFASYTETF